MYILQLGTFLAGLYCGFWFFPGSDPLEAGYPQEASGNIRFLVDPVRFLDDGSQALEVFVALPEEALHAEDDSFRIATSIQMLGTDGRGIAEYRTDISIPPAAARETESGFPVPLRWLRFYPTWLPGTQGIEVKIRDLSTLKDGLLDRVRGRHPEGSTSGYLGRERGDVQKLEWLSDLFFVWGPLADAEAGDQDEPGLRSVRSRLQPNPHRYYGLHKPVLTVYWEQYPAPAGSLLGPDDMLVLRQRIVEQQSNSIVFASAETLRVHTTPDWTLRRFDLKELPSGAYSFELELDEEDSDGGRLASSSGLFQVIWEDPNWILDQSELLAIGRVVLPSRDFEVFENLDRGEQEGYLRDLWNRNAPTRPGETNPLEEKLIERARFADEHYGERLRRGIVTDRGRVYIRYGEPDVIRANLNPQDEELLVHVLAQEAYEDGSSRYLDGGRRGSVRRRYANSAYVIWEYSVRGDPLLSDYLDHTSKIGLKFIFVDDLGVGDFRLIYSNAPGVLH